MKSSTRALALCLSLVLPGAAALGDDACSALADATPPDTQPEEWVVDVAPYAWLFGMSGNLSKGGRTLPVNFHLGDAVDLVQDDLKFGIAGHLEARKGRWGVFLDGDYLQFKGSKAASRDVKGQIAAENVRVDVDMELDISLVELGATFRVTQLESAVEGATIPIDVIGGARWNRVSLDVDLDVSGYVTTQRFQQAFDKAYSPSFTEDWVDPFIGARTVIPLSETIALHVRGDIGGGGFGSGADRAWNVVTGLSWKVGDTVDVFVGYRWYDFERHTSGRDVNLQMSGPGIGAVFRF